MADKPQSFEKHAKLVPGFHYVTLGLLAVFAMFAVANVLEEFNRDTLKSAALGAGVILLWMYARVFANQNQDRIIRLEERLRMQELLPDDLQGRINSFTTSQLVALRFASDAELPELARKVLDEGITDRKEIKRLVKEWRPDHHRV